MLSQILAIIPARGNSKGLPRKNIKPLHGIPLIEYTIEAAKRSQYINRFMVSTDNAEIGTVAKRAGAEVPFLRPSHLAQDRSKVMDTCLYVLDQYKQDQGFEPDLVALLQPTSPLRHEKHIDEAIRLLKSKDADSVLSVCQTEHSPYWLMNINTDGTLEPFLTEERVFKNRQEFRNIYRLNGSIYVAKTSLVKEKHTFFGTNTYPYIMPIMESIDIDSPLDFQMASLLLTARNNEQG